MGNLKVGNLLCWFYGVIRDLGFFLIFIFLVLGCEFYCYVYQKIVNVLVIMINVQLERKGRLKGFFYLVFLEVFV